MSNLISTFQERFGDWVAALGQHLQLSLLTLLLAIFLAVPSGYLFEYPQKNKQLGFTASWDLPDHSFHGPSGALHSYYGNRDASGLDSSRHLCHFPHPSKYHHRFTRDWSKPWRSGNRLWDDQVGALEEVWDSLGHARHHVWNSDSSCDDYRDGYPSCLDWSRGTRFLYPSRDWPQ